MISQLYPFLPVAMPRVRRAGGLQHLFRQHCRFQLFRFCKREHPLFHRDCRHGRWARWTQARTPVFL